MREDLARAMKNKDIEIKKLRKLVESHREKVLDLEAEIRRLRKKIDELESERTDSRKGA